jgi:hypothetical protein
VLGIKKLAMMLNSDAIFDKFNVFASCTNGNYAQKWVTKLQNY